MQGYQLLLTLHLIRFILFIILEIDKISTSQPSLKLEEVELDNEGAADELNEFLNST